MPMNFLVNRVQNCQSYSAMKTFYLCEICMKPFSPSNNLSGHTSVSSREKMSCEMCVRLLTHKRSAMRPSHGRKMSFSCNVCNNSFTHHSNLDNRIRIQTAEWSLSREMCKKRFAWWSYLIRHLRVHSGEQPLRVICAKKCTR
jgi:KRAB domain-containing zinc finger protein